MVFGFPIRGWRLQWSAKLSPELSEIEPNWCQNHSQIIKNPSHIHQNDAQERSESDLGIKSVPGTVFWSTTRVLGVAFCRHLGHFGCHVGHRWAPRVSQNRAFWHQEASKVGKMMFRKGWWKKLENSMGLWLENGSLGGAKSLIFHCFFNRIVVSAFFEKAWKFDRNWFPKCSQNPLKIWHLALGGRIFAILGGF